MYYMLWIYMFVALLPSMQSACAVLYRHIWPIRFCHCFPHYHINGTIFGEKTVSEHKICHFLSLQMFSKTFLILRRIPRDIIRSVHRSSSKVSVMLVVFNPLRPTDPYSGRTAPLTSKRCNLYIYSTNTGTEHFKHGIYSPFFSLQDAVCFIILIYLVPVLFKFNIQNVLKFKKIIPAPEG